MRSLWDDIAASHSTGKVLGYHLLSRPCRNRQHLLQCAGRHHKGFFRSSKPASNHCVISSCKPFTLINGPSLDGSHPLYLSPNSLTNTLPSSESGSSLKCATAAWKSLPNSLPGMTTVASAPS